MFRRSAYNIFVASPWIFLFNFWIFLIYCFNYFFICKILLIIGCVKPGYNDVVYKFSMKLLEHNQKLFGSERCIVIWNSVICRVNIYCKTTDLTRAHNLFQDMCASQLEPTKNSQQSTFCIATNFKHWTISSLLSTPPNKNCRNGFL